jgi:hypothetical protein
MEPDFFCTYKKDRASNTDVIALSELKTKNRNLL